MINVRSILFKPVLFASKSWKQLIEQALILQTTVKQFGLCLGFGENPLSTALIPSRLAAITDGVVCCLQCWWLLCVAVKHGIVLYCPKHGSVFSYPEI